jgi:phage gp29-like protein
MPTVTNDRIEFTVNDRYLIEEQSTGLTFQQFANMINAAKEGRTTDFFKFLEEIYEKDPDIASSIQTRSVEVLSKDWKVMTEDNEEDEELTRALKDITGDTTTGLLSTDQLIGALLGASYLTGVSLNEIITDENGITGFSHIPSPFLTYQKTLYFPDLYTQDAPTGQTLESPEKFILHYLDPAVSDKTRGYLGIAIGWQYLFKTQNMKDMLRYQGKYGKPFLCVMMDKEGDGYDVDFENVKKLITNIGTVDGIVVSRDVNIEMTGSTTLDGSFFFDSDETYKKNIAKIILGQTSTSDSTDSNRSTAAVHMSVLEQRVMSDMELIEESLSKQLVPHVTELLGRSYAGERFKFIISDLEDAIDEDVEQDEDEGISSEETQGMMSDAEETEV